MCFNLVGRGMLIAARVCARAVNCGAALEVLVGGWVVNPVVEDTGFRAGFVVCFVARNLFIELISERNA